MQQIFSFKRVWYLLIKQWHEQKKTLLLLALAATILLFVFEYLSSDPLSYKPLSEDYQSIYFYLFLALLFVLYSFSYFSIMNKKEQATTYLLVPASHFEKILLAIFFSTFLILLLWCIIFLSVNELMVNWLNFNAFHNKVKYSNMYEGDFFIARKTVSLKTLFTQGQTLLALCFILQSVAFLGSVYFKHYAVVKTICVALIIYFLLYQLQMKILPHLFNSQFVFNGFEKFIKTPSKSNLNVTDYLNASNYNYIFVPTTFKYFVMYSLLFGVWIFLTIITFFRLKEKQV